MKSAGLVAIVSLSAAGCHPLSPWHPPSLQQDTPRSLRSNNPFPHAAVNVVVDDMGVPHIYGDDEEDLVYGLGFMHARDRLFQLDVIRHAAHGRLAELFGADLVPVDRKLRLINLAARSQLARVSDRDRRLLDSYAAGVNAGAAHAGRSIDMVVLGTRFAPFTALDALAIGDLQAWDLARGMVEELYQERVIGALSVVDARRSLLLSPVTSGGVPIVATAQDTTRTSTLTAERLLRNAPTLKGGATRPAESLSPRAQSIVEWLGMHAPAASNSWVVSGEHTESGHAVLCNDPHLAHRAPSVFYLAHLEHDDFTVVGATFPGVPAVLIGHTRHLAWGMTASYADVQDLVRIEVDPDSDDHYRVDGERVRYGRMFQVFATRDREVEPLVEVWKTTLFGPLLPPAFTDGIKLDNPLALMWSGFDTYGATSQSISGLWDLARAKDLAEVDSAIDKFSIAGQNMAIAFVDGTIAYRLAALTPVRTASTGGDIARHGYSSDVAWNGFLPVSKRPGLTNPPPGFIVTANQRIVADDSQTVRSVGRLGGTPDRARRIRERIEALLARGRPSADELLAIQQDIVWVEARQLAPLLGRSCPKEVAGHEAGVVASFCDAINGFDGAFDLESTAARAYATLIKALWQAVLQTHVDLASAETLGRASHIQSLIGDAVIADSSGRPSILFDDPATPAREGLPHFIALAAKSALDTLVESAGGDPDDWRWGDEHVLELSGPLARAPVIGGFWRIDAGEQPGYGRAPRAESGLPIRHGAAFRMVAEMTDPPTVRMVIDAGNSGHPGHQHWDDQTALWSAGAPFTVPVSAEAIEAHAEGRLRLLPR